MTFCANLVVCLSLPPLNNGMVSYNDSTLGLDTVATHSCDTGYTLNGGSTRTCGSDGVWSGASPTCQDTGEPTASPPTTCSHLTNLANGTISYSLDVTPDYDLGTNATYTCEAGFYLEGNEVRVCMDDDGMDAIGVWSGQEPSCVHTHTAIECPPLDTITNGKIVYATDVTFNFDLGTTATYSCNDGYTLIGVEVRTCIDNENNDTVGVFSGQEPACVRIQCTPLPDIPNGRIEYTPDTTANYMLETTATYICNDRFFMDLSVGNEVRTCEDLGEFTGSQPTCVPIQCPPLNLVPNGFITYAPDNTSDYDLGTVATYTCDAGFVLNLSMEGSANMTTCVNDNRMNAIGVFDRLAPRCVPIECPVLPVFANGIIVYATDVTPDFDLGTTATYSCNDGYSLVLSIGVEIRSCIDDGNNDASGVFSDQAPACVLIQCPPLDSIANGFITYAPDNTPSSNHELDTVATYTCNTGYTLNGVATSTCESNGMWSGLPPVCEQILICSDLSLITNGDIIYSEGSPDNRRIFSTATYSCNPGYTLTGGSTLRFCMSGGTWSESAPTCQAIECPPLRTIINGMISYSPDVTPGYDLGTEANHTCEAGFYLEGNEVRVCMEDDGMDAIGVWSDQEPSCVPIQCPPLDSIVNGVITYAPVNTPISNHELDTVATYACDPGFVLDLSPGVSEMRTCVDNNGLDAIGVWRGQEPSCVPITCLRLPDHSHTSIIYLPDTTSSFPYGTQAMYTISCPEGMERDGGDDVRTCTSDGISAVGVWSGTVPICASQKVYLSHGNTHYYANNTAIIISSIMTTNDTSLTCHTDSITCCRGVDNLEGSTGFGQWLFPNRTEISRRNGITGSGFYWSRDYQSVRLYHQSDIQTPLGTYCCRIPDNSGVMRTFCTNIIIATRCAQLMTAPENGMVFYSNEMQNITFIFGTVATYICSPGYGLSSTQSRTCITVNGGGTIGRFSGSEPTCDRITCSALPSITNGTINYFSGTTAPYDYGTTATYQCNYGHVLITRDSVRTCTGDGSSPSGQWDGTALQCPPVDCETPPSITNGSPGIPTTTTFTGTVTYSCNDGYALFGIATSTCQANTTWSSSPECRAVPPPVRSVLFQLRLTNINNCPDWVDQDGRIEAVMSAFAVEVGSHCGCGFSSMVMTAPLFRCFPGSDRAVTFRAFLTDSRLLTPIQDWIQTNGFIPIQNVLIEVDKSCPVQISSLADTECTNQPVAAGSSDTAAVVGGVVGVVIVVGFVVIVIATLLFKSRREKLTVHRTRTNEVPPGSLKGVVSTGEIQSYEMIETGHEYEEVSKFQRVAGGEYEIIGAPSQTTGSESKAPIKTESLPPTPPTPQVTKPAGNDIEFTECVAYSTTTHSCPPQPTGL